MERVHFAAAFVDAGGERRLRRAIRVAEADGRDTLAARGRTVVTALEAFRIAAVNDDEPIRETPSAAQSTSTTLAQRSSGEGA